MEYYELLFHVSNFYKTSTNIRKNIPIIFTKRPIVLFPSENEILPGVYPPILVINNFYRDWGHQVIYDYKTLEMLLHKYGFTNIKRCQLYESEHRSSTNMEKHDQATYKNLSKIESTVIEASC